MAPKERSGRTSVEDEVIEKCFIQPERVEVPVEVTNQQLFEIDQLFLDKMPEVKSFIRSEAWAFSIQHVLTFTILSHLQYRKVDAILTQY